MNAGPVTAIVLAAGRGERMRPLSDERPKPLLEVAGRSLIEHQILRLAAAGIRRVVVNLAWKGEMIRAALGDGAALGVAIDYSEEPEGALDSGGGIVQAMQRFDDARFIVANGDVYTDLDFRRLVLGDEDLARLVLVPNPAHHTAGDFALADGRVSDAEGERLTFSGIGVYRRELFRDRRPGRFPLAPILYQAAASGRVAGIRHDGLWWDVGTPQRLEALQRRLGD